MTRLLARLALLLVLFPAAVGRASSADERAAEQIPEVRELLSTLAKAVADNHLVGAQLVIGTRNAFVLDRCLGTRGPGDPAAVDGQTLFCIGSCSKPVAAACLLQLAADHKLTMDTSIDH